MGGHRGVGGHLVCTDKTYELAVRIGDESGEAQIVDALAVAAVGLVVDLSR
jgi:hypothetical protein